MLHNKNANISTKVNGTAFSFFNEKEEEQLYQTEKFIQDATKKLSSFETAGTTVDMKLRTSGCQNNKIFEMFV